MVLCSLELPELWNMFLKEIVRDWSGNDEINNSSSNALVHLNVLHKSPLFTLYDTLFDFIRQLILLHKTTLFTS